MVKSRADYEKEWRDLVQAGIDRANSRLDDLTRKIDNLHVQEIGKLKEDMAVLKVKSGVWGFIAGLVPAVGAVLYIVLAGHK